MKILRQCIVVITACAMVLFMTGCSASNTVKGGAIGAAAGGALGAVIGNAAGNTAVGVCTSFDTLHALNAIIISKKAYLFICFMLLLSLNIISIRVLLPLVYHLNGDDHHRHRGLIQPPEYL